jgi:hypothetical protein
MPLIKILTSTQKKEFEELLCQQKIGYKILYSLPLKLLLLGQN